MTAIDQLEAQVADLAETLVDPSGQDASRAVGVVVILVSESYTGVLGFGALRKGGTQRPDGGTFFQIGSVTKVLTGLLLASRVEQGLAADTAVNDLLANDVQAPSFSNVPITLEQLASHYGAMPHELPDNVTGPAWSPAKDYSRAQLAEYLAGYGLPYSPGSQYVYSNTGSGLLGLALADANGAPDFHSVLTATLTGPLGMTDTGTNAPAFLGGIGDRLAQGYYDQGGTLVDVDLADMGVLAGGGEVISTGNDIALLLRTFTGLDAYPVPGAVERALTPVGPGESGAQVGYGVNILTTAEGSTFEKSGIASGYSTNIRFRRDPAVGVGVMVNRRSMQPITTVAKETLLLLEAFAP